MFKRGGTPNTGIMDGFGEDRVMASSGKRIAGTNLMVSGGDMDDEKADVFFAPGSSQIMGTTPSPTATEDEFVRKEMEKEPIMDLADYASLFKLGAGIAGAPGRGSGLGGLLAASSEPLQTAADEFAASQRAKAERRRAFEEREDAREDAFKAEQRQRTAQQEDLQEEYRLKTELEKLKADLDVPDIQLRMNAAKPVRQELAALKAQKDAVKDDPVAMKNLLLEIRAKQNEISEIMGTAITVGDLSDEKSDDIRKDAKRDALNDIKSGLTDEEKETFKKSDIEPGGKYYDEYNSSLKAYEQFYIVEYLLLVTEGATMATGGSVQRVGLQQGGQAMDTSPMLTFEELRARLPKEVSDQVVRLIATSEAALLDFANIDTQEDISIFNQKYNVDLQLPTQVA